MTVFIDFETKSEADLMKVGAYVYSLHPSTDVICLCWAVDDGPVQEWWPGKNDGLLGAEENWWNGKHDTIPPELDAAIEAGEEFEAHNIGFEYSIWRNVMHARYGWPAMPDDQWFDTMAVCCYYALPAALDGVARALGFGIKNPEGTRLITKYSKLYLKTAKRFIPWDDYRKFVDYCKDDVRLERRVANFLGPLPAHEKQVWRDDFEIHRRGLYLDAAGIDAAATIADALAAERTEEFIKLVGYKPTQTARVKDWFDIVCDLPLELSLIHI